MIYVDFDKKDYPYEILVTDEERWALDWEGEEAAFQKTEEYLSQIEREMNPPWDHLPYLGPSEPMDCFCLQWLQFKNEWELLTKDCWPNRCRCDDRGEHCGWRIRDLLDRYKHFVRVQGKYETGLFD